MSLDILFKMKLFQNDADIPTSRKCLLYLLEALVNCNRVYLRSHPETPLLYRAGVEYIKDPRPYGPDNRRIENWITIPEVLENAGSDCKNLVGWRVAELRELGVTCRPFIKWQKLFDRNGALTLFHVVVQFGPYDERTKFEDPSKLLGMGREDSF